MTSWAAIPFVEVINRVVNFDICSNGGEIKPRGNPVWAEICQIWKRPSGKYLKSPIALYFDFKQNRNDIFNRYLKERNLNFSHTDENKCIISSENEESIEVADSKEKFIGFNINFTKEEWLRIKPIEKLDCNNKKYYTLKNGWTAIITELIYITQKLPCAFKFSQQYVYHLNTENNIDKFILKISGSCTEKLCKAVILGECIFSFNEDENVSMLIHTANTLDIPHSKKRPITGEQRREFAKELQLKKGELYKRNLIEKYQQYGEQAPPIIPNAPVLNQIRYEGKKIRLGIQGSIWDSLKHLKHSNVEFSHIIKQIGFDKFFVMYWTHQQTDLYNDLLVLKPIISIDATGSVVRKIPSAENYHNGPIFLYQMVTYIDSLIVPVCQMLSERHDTKIVAFWLYEWISSKAKVPLEIVTDMSEALQNGICLAICNMTYKQYLSNCYKFLIGKSKILSQVYVRIDIAHLIHSVSTHKCFSSVKSVIKDLYLRAIGLMSTMENLLDIEKMMKALLNISQNEYGCKNDIQWILTKLETFKFDDTAIDYKKLKNSSSCDKQNFCDTHLFCDDEEIKKDDFGLSNSSVDLDLSDYVDKLVKNTPNNIHSNSSINFDDVNPYHLVGILEKLIKLFKQFPSWTNVMRKHFGSENYVATSSRSENYFKYIKDNVLDDRQLTRADMFLIQHVKTISTRLIEARAAYEKQQMIQKLSNVRKKINLSDECILNCEENWRNQNKPADTIEMDLAEDEFSDNGISIDEIDAVLKKIKNDASETKTLNKLELFEQIISTKIVSSLTSDSESLSTFARISSNTPAKISSDITARISSDTPAKISSDIPAKISSDSSLDIFLCTRKESNISSNNDSNLSEPKFSSTPNSFSDSLKSLKISFKQKLENSFSIVLDEQPIQFKIHENQTSVKRKKISNSTSCQPIKRGKYVNPFPAIKIFHQNAADKNSKKTKKRKMIQNGSIMGSRKIGKLKLSFRNTCPFDSITELLSFAYLNFKSF